jgi:hypothetical protein
MSPGRGSTPSRTDWLTVSCKVTLTLRPLAYILEEEVLQQQQALNEELCQKR